MNTNRERGMMTDDILTATEIERRRKELSSMVSQELNEIMQPLIDQLNDLIIKHSGKS